MNIYISGISGTGMGPLALMAKQAGFSVFGSDLSEGAVYEELIRAGIEVKIGEQDGEFLREKLETGVDWFVHTSALPENHPELVLAREAGVKVSKRDEFTAWLVEKMGLKMVAVAGTHGKTTTTAMIVWTALKLRLPASFIVGTTLGFAPAGAYHTGDKYFIYEADEYDRNFLKFSPWTAVITTVSYDHPDIYPTKEDYQEAFLQFERQSERIVTPEATAVFTAEDFQLAGEVRRKDAALAAEAISLMIREENAGESASESSENRGEIGEKRDEIIRILDDFPGAGRRFEKLADGVYTDYAHHPEEIATTVEMAREEAEKTGKTGVVVVYQPHQNTRQHKVRAGYEKVFLGIDKIFWLPTYLTREDPNLPVLSPEELISGLENREKAEASELSGALESRLKEYLKQGYLVILMTAGPADKWFREKFGE